MRYLCYDAALNEEYTLFQLQKIFPKHKCLFEGTADEQLWDVAPWIFEIQGPVFSLFDKDVLASFKRTTVFESYLAINEFCEFLQHYLYHKEKDKEYYFRFWDAKVMALYLDSSDAQQLSEFYGDGISTIYCDENEDKLICFQITKHNKLQKSFVTKAAFDGVEATVATQVNLEIEQTKEEPIKKPRRFFLD